MEKKNYLEEKEIHSFLKCWFKNTNKELEFHDSTGNKITIENKNLINFYVEFLKVYQRNKNHRIVGCDVMKNFSINLSSSEDLIKVSQELWDNPERFYDIDGKDSYYDFLKYLWIESSDFPNETRLTDIIKIETV